MPDTAPAALRVRNGDNIQDVVREGGNLPASSKIVMATQKAGQASITFDLLEGPAALIAHTTLELPRGLPANCWIPVFFRVSAEGRVQVEAKENLRRLQIDGKFDTAGAAASFYTT